VSPDEGVGRRLTAIPGDGPVVLLAPHGGRRDPARRPWAERRLRVNDLHTAALTAELARRLDAPALVNADHDRNDVDLNRVSETERRAPWFLEALRDTLAATVARHGRATVLVVHGWNVVEPVADLGVGGAIGDGAAAVTPAFATTGLRALLDACAARGIVATVGARYPARHRENLLQLFTSRYADDPRPLVRAVATYAPRVDAVQLELGIPLRWPGTWRARLLDACAAALPALAGRPAAPIVPPAVEPAEDPSAVRFEFTSAALCGLVATDAGGARLLLFPPGGGLVLFTGERVAGQGPRGLRVVATAEGGLAIRLRGPLLRFAETTPFLDLETGLASAALVEADVALDFRPDGSRAFGDVAGSVVVEGDAFPVDGHGFAMDPAATPDVWPRFRAALRIGDGAVLALTVGLPGEARGFLRAGDREEAVRGAEVELAAWPAPLERVRLAVRLDGGRQLDLELRALHRLPVVRARGSTPLRLEFAACRLVAGPEAAAGWCEVGGL